MRIVYLNGVVEEHSWHEMRKLFWHPHFVAMVLFLACIVFILRPYDDLVNFDIVRLTIFYAISVVSFVLLLVSSVFVTQWMGRVVYTWMTITFSIIGATVFGLGVSLVLGAEAPPLIELLLIGVFNLVFGFLGEVILVSFLLSGIMRDIRAGNAAPSVPENPFVPETPAPAVDAQKAPPFEAAPITTERMVDLFGTEFRQKDILALAAEAHYVSVLLAGKRKKLLRGKISDAVEALPEELGQVIHRSYWVAGSAVVGVVQSGRNSFIELTDGTKFAIARNRLSETRLWVDQLDAKKKKAP